MKKRCLFKFSNLAAEQDCGLFDERPSGLIKDNIPFSVTTFLMMKTMIMKYNFYFLFLYISFFSSPSKAQVTDIQRALFEMEDFISTYSDRDVDVEDQLERISNQKKMRFQPPFSINIMS